MSIEFIKTKRNQLKPIHDGYLYIPHGTKNDQKRFWCVKNLYWIDNCLHKFKNS